MGAPELGRDGLSEDHRARLPQSPDGRVVPPGEVPAERLAAVLGRHVLRLEEVLDPHRHAIDGGERLARGPALRARVRGSAGQVPVEVREGPDHRLALLDGRQAALEEVAGSVSARPEPPGGIVERQGLVGPRVVARRG